MANLREIHQQSYSDMPFDDFARRFHAKSYADMPFEQFMQRAVPEQKLAINDVMGSDGVSGDQLRANAAGNTRSQMRPQDIEAAYGVAQARGDRLEQQAMANAFVDRERRDSPLMMGAGDRFRSMARGVPFVGEFLDEANARTAHPFDAKKREMRLDYERARDTSFDAANPYQSMAGKVTGGIAGTIAMLPMAAATGTSALLGAGAKTVPGAIGRGLVGGVTQGAASGYGREGTLAGAQRDALIGGAFGLGVPAAMALGKAGIDRLVGAFAPSDILSSVPKKAQAYFLSQFSPKNMTAMRGELDRLGPNAVLADVSPEMLGIAQGAASRPGSREAIVNALTVRDQGKNARLAQGLDENLSRVVEPSAIRAGIQENMDTVGLQYGDTFRQNASAVRTQPIADTLDALSVDLRGPAQKAVRDVRGMLNIPGNTQQLDPSPSALHQTREAIDGLFKTETNPKVIAQLSNARRLIDEELSAAVPGIKQVDARFQELARQKGALDEGSRIFRTGPEATRPFDLRQQITEGAQPKGVNIGPSAEPLRNKQGARAEIDRLIGQSSRIDDETGKEVGNSVAAVRSLLKGRDNADKLKATFGEDRANAALRLLDNESQMEATKRLVVDGSQTGVKRGFGKFIDEAGQGVTVPAEATAVGLGIRGAKSLLERLTGSNNAAKATRFADELGNLSIAGGSDADRIIAAIMKRQAQTASGEKFNEAFGRIGAGAARADDPMAIKLAIAAAILGRDAAKMRGSDQSGSRR
jgi:hypothetical protein